MSESSSGSVAEEPAVCAEPDDGRVADQLPVAGLTRLSTCDWPGRLVATVFVQGCPWRCGYCHNPDLIDPRTPGAIPWSVVREHLRQRRGLLDGVVFTGGEPTATLSLPAAMRQARQLGYRVGLHTSGAHPQRLQHALPMVDWVGLDIKGLAAQYEAITGRVRAAQQAYDSLHQVLTSGVDYEVRVTVDPRYHSVAGLAELMADLRYRGVTNLVLQPVRVDATGSTAVADALLDQLDLPEGVSRRR